MPLDQTNHSVFYSYSIVPLFLHHHSSLCTLPVCIVCFNKTTQSTPPPNSFGGISLSLWLNLSWWSEHRPRKLRSTFEKLSLSSRPLYFPRWQILPLCHWKQIHHSHSWLIPKMQQRQIQVQTFNLPIPLHVHWLEATELQRVARRRDKKEQQIDKRRKRWSESQIV